MKDFFDEASNLVFTVEGLKLLHQTLNKHCDKMIETEILEDIEKQGTELGDSILATLRDISGIDDDKEMADMPNLVFLLLTLKQIEESIKSLRELMVEEIEPLEATFLKLVQVDKE